MQVLDCVVVGAGQSGLCTAKDLADKGISYVVLEKDQIGGVWLKRPKEMRLFTSRQFCGLPGMSFPGEKEGYPLVDEVAEYLKAYAERFRLNVREGVSVISVTKDKNIFEVTLNNSEVIHCKSVINATGSNQMCLVPDIAKGLSSDVMQCIAERRSFSDIPADSRVLVVGDGASGRQIAGGIAEQCKEVIIATGDKRGLPPNRVLGRDIFWWLKRLGILFADKDSLIATILKKRNPVPCKDFNNSRLAHLGVDIKPRVTACKGRTVKFADGTELDVDVVVWAVGYIEDTGWLKLNDSVDENGFVEDYGVCPTKGLFMVGRKWLSCRASELILGVENDAAMIVDRVVGHLKVEF